MTAFEATTAAGRLRILWDATADPQLAMSDDEVADVETVLLEHAAMVAELVELKSLIGTEPRWRYRAFGPDNEIAFDPDINDRWTMTDLGGWRIERQPIYFGAWEPAPELVEGNDDD